MNTKKIWIISLILGIAVAGIAYLSVFSKGKVSTTTTTVAVAQNNDEKKTDEEQAKKEEALKREFNNPLVDVSNGKRAISINVDPAQGVSGYIAPNSKVDVIAYGTKKDDKTKKEYRSAVLVLENVKVLSSGKSSDTKEEALHYETVTLEVTPKEGVMLSLAAKDKDGFYLMLRNTEDTDKGKVGLKQTREVIKEGD
ncbi:Flp pilus assembly protein CpaB [Neobacillus cucumis]|uniref:Flp pilus assembly protein CpaB n=1 Tax=Neobacillus cucumis TaxID=1740721 RepID=UPI0018E0630D|nr:Flp pilus assembly protein CpaB [Neobacillus cucumis]MBI0577631.1 Flp pilus assembly protein CpaB [Neobacillus cucumis]